ncbi:GlsB/YeaQ/YmgE family stress response membrane protein [Paenirhodobacter populi]|uniref:GlsB/YeaQ/YmgE family stress response membrane protein n=1 Tax=Paenirhodobacter populi TaxID=2306993 RepID=A0A443J8E8_9RHOB|nr:GlsB/YeaQ/YmgE family stress response membrane protein [Sinirhodobacter populi]RWR06603.1 GlsB/YeaQ/YmgE family stress response membrane protein [Sinirhodobacter populi]RWR06814.1 GlsB/YeaQ/YmgE family stress response membrane protein [Sinirhodobacter populi]RWR16772.1 GlsB/YeaQ/YmgE family stress response membrane protein [Sinirhodobacter populi]RWR26463.1 GlsB/YeaQ/YmgE family stress response membrane protein [Sinirhodobacter populi]RWR33885.1 GlsB/YeaQ/YmgE family stress response membran
MGLGFFASIIIGGLAGWIGSRIMDANTGIFLNVILGIVGAIIANAILALLGIYAANAWLPQLIVGTLGAIILIALGRAFKR